MWTAPLTWALAEESKLPRVFSIEELEQEPTDEMYEDETFDPFLTLPEAFQYLPAPDMGGPAGSVHVAVKPEQVGKIKNKPTLYERITSGKQRPQDEWEVKAEVEAARFAVEMAAFGAVRAYMRYDGGNDEGFAWFDHCVLKDGSTRDADQVAVELERKGLAPNMKTWGSRSATRNALDDLVAGIWAAKLLGQGYGAGEYVMYGAFWVDLETGLATDDQQPAPIVRNIQFKTQ